MSEEIGNSEVKKKKKKKKWPWIVGAIVVLGIIGEAMGGGNSGGSVSTEPSSASNSVVAAAASAASTASSSSADFSSAELTENSIKQALSKTEIKDIISKVKIDNGIITITTDNKNALSLKSFLELNQSYSVDAFQVLFKNKNAKEVVYDAQIPVNDAYGKTSIVTGQTNTMERADAMKVSDWETFKYENPSQFYSVVNYQLATEAQVSGIHKAWSEFYK